MARRIPRQCIDCGRVRLNNGRGLCAGCHRRHTSDGTLSDYPRLNRSCADVIEDAEFLVGESAETAADRMGMTAAAISKALARSGRSDLAARYDAAAQRSRYWKARA